MSHLSKKGMKILSAKGLIPTCRSVSFCEDCVRGKQKLMSFLRSSPERKKEKLKLVHTDLWGPTPVQSHGGSRYYLTFIDDATRKTCVYFLKHKSAVIEVFKSWKAEVENETGRRLKCLKSDNRGKYEGTNLKVYCVKHGVKLVRTVPNSPQQNGIAERMNRTINERARAMRLHVGLPKAFWVDAVNTPVYLINRSPSTAVDLELPE